MNRMHRVLVLVLSLGLLATSAASALGTGHADLSEVRRAVAEYHDRAAAEKAGWSFVQGLDHCFDNPGVGGMGFHLINTDLLDATVEERRPEALVYVPKPNGELALGAVEWIVPADAWAATGASGPPRVLDQDMHLVEALGVWVTHAWIFRHNPAGILEDWNPRVSCPHLH